MIPNGFARRTEIVYPFLGYQIFAFGSSLADMMASVSLRFTDVNDDIHRVKFTVSVIGASISWRCCSVILYLTGCDHSVCGFWTGVSGSLTHNVDLFKHQTAISPIITADCLLAPSAYSFWVISHWSQRALWSSTDAGVLLISYRFSYIRRDIRPVSVR